METGGISVRFQGWLQVLRFSSPDWDHMYQRQFRETSFAECHTESGINHVCIHTKPHFRTDGIKSPSVRLRLQPTQIGERNFAAHTEPGTPRSAGMMILHIGPEGRVYRPAAEQRF